MRRRNIPDGQMSLFDLLKTGHDDTKSIHKEPDDEGMALTLKETVPNSKDTKDSNTEQNCSNIIPEAIVISLLESDQISSEARFDIETVFINSEPLSSERLTVVEKRLARKNYGIEGNEINARFGHGLTMKIDNKTFHYMWHPVLAQIDEMIKKGTWLSAEARNGILREREYVG